MQELLSVIIMDDATRCQLHGTATWNFFRYTF